jgi:hypothetical protein
MTTGIHYTKLVEIWPGRTEEDSSFSDLFHIEISTELHKFRFPTQLDRKLAAGLRIQSLQFGSFLSIQNEWPLEAIHGVWFACEMNPALLCMYRIVSNRVVREPVRMMFCAVLKVEKIHSIDFTSRYPHKIGGQMGPSRCRYCGADLICGNCGRQN